MHKLGIIADNLIGSSDTGVQFSKHNLSTVVISEQNKLQNCQNDAVVICVNTNTRAAKPDKAAECVQKITKILKKMGVDHFYKKIDSTLRGNIAVEIEAMMDILGMKMAILVPSFPANGRIVENGYLLSMKDDKTFYPLCHVPSLLQSETEQAISQINLSDVRKGIKNLQNKIFTLKELDTKIVVIDAVNEEDLFTIAQSIKKFSNQCIFAGSAGLASHLPYVLDLDDDISIRRERFVLVLAGTFNRITAEQIKELSIDKSIELIKFPTDVFSSGDSRIEIERIRKKTEKILADSKTAVIVLDTLLKDREELEGYKISENVELYGKEIARSLGLIAKELAIKGLITDLIVTGGGTATHVVESLGADYITLEDELLPGIPSGKLQGGECAGLRIVTKAGGFGSREALKKIVEYLRENKPYLLN